LIDAVEAAAQAAITTNGLQDIIIAANLSTNGLQDISIAALSTNANAISANFTPTNYVPSAGDVSSHLQGIDEEIGSLVLTQNFQRVDINDLYTSNNAQQVEINDLGASFTGISVTQNAKVSETTAGEKQIMFPFERLDSGNLWTTGTFTTPSDGYYQINSSITVKVAALTTSLFQAFIKINTNLEFPTTAQAEWQIGVFQPWATLTHNTMVYLSAGDTIEIWMGSLGPDATYDIAFWPKGAVGRPMYSMLQIYKVHN